MTNVKLIIKKTPDEYELRHFLDNRQVKRRTYFTDDLEDAQLTLKAEITWYIDMLGATLVSQQKNSATLTM
jgi:hypothetical protein